MNDGMFVRSDRLDYSLPTCNISWLNCFCACSRMCAVVTHLCSGSRILCIHWGSHSEQKTVNHYTFLHSDRLDYSLQIQKEHLYLSLTNWLTVSAQIHTSVLAEVSCVPTGTVTVSIGRRTMACSSVLTGWTTVCKLCI